MNYKIIVMLMCLFTNITAKSTCNILALGGGGSHGAFQAGIISNLISQNKSWDYITGVSVGAINAAYMSTIPRGQEKNYLPEIKSLWSGIGNSDIYSVKYFLNKQSLYSTKPLQDTLHTIFKNRPIINNVTISATSLVTLKRTLFTEKDLQQSLDPLMASSAIPILFPPYTIKNDSFVDGGLSGNILIQEGIYRCGENDVINIDAILCTNIYSKYNTIPKNILDIIPRIINIIENRVEYTNIDRFLSKSSVANFVLYSPLNDLPVSYIDFSKGEQLFEYGIDFKNVKINVIK